MQCLQLLTIFFLYAGNPISIEQLTQQKTISIQADQKGELWIDRVKIQRERLANELEQRLWRGYITSSIMVKNIQLIVEGSPNPAFEQELKDAIKKGQERTLAILSLHKYGKRFEDIGNSKQERLRKQFPVLFQEVEPV